MECNGGGRVKRGTGVGLSCCEAVRGERVTVQLKGMVIASLCGIEQFRKLN